MPKEDLIELVNALASVGYKILSFNWEEVSYASPHIETVELKILKNLPKKEKS
jgi:hypothetical protein